jgi:hypothetical protein
MFCIGKDVSNSEAMSSNETAGLSNNGASKVSVRAAVDQTFGRSTLIGQKCDPSINKHSVDQTFERSTLYGQKIDTSIATSAPSAINSSVSINKSMSINSSVSINKHSVDSIVNGWTKKRKLSESGCSELPAETCSTEKKPKTLEVNGNDLGRKTRYLIPTF